MRNRLQSPWFPFCLFRGLAVIIIIIIINYYCYYTFSFVSLFLFSSYFAIALINAPVASSPVLNRQCSYQQITVAATH